MPRCLAFLVPALTLAALGCARAAEGTEPSPAAAPLKVCLVSASAEYKSDASLAGFQKFLESRYRIACTRVFGADQGDKLPDLEAIDACDVMLLFARRVTLPADQLERVRRYCAAGRPIVGVRTASHAFQNWLAFDKEVLGGNYHGHYGSGPPSRVAIVEGAKDHPVLKGVEPFASPYSLYKNAGLAGDVEPLMTGTIPGHTEPVAWTRVHNDGRIFYTSLGGPDDFKNENFRRMLASAIFWTSKRPVEAKERAAEPGPSPGR